MDDECNVWPPRYIMHWGHLVYVGTSGEAVNEIVQVGGFPAPSWVTSICDVCTLNYASDFPEESRGLKGAWWDVPVAYDNPRKLKGPEETP
eukprot:463158-Pyramimonas_sp.AAC.1